MHRRLISHSGCVGSPVEAVVKKLAQQLIRGRARAGKEAHNNLTERYSRVILKRNGVFIYKEVSSEGARPGGVVSLSCE